MAAFTIGYTPQFIQSDIGAIQKRFADMQSQYDLGYQQSLEAEDAFGNIPVVSQSDMELRDEVLGGFKNRVQSIVDEYGGDYGAASKRLAKEIIATKSNPFFQLAARKAQLAEEQRKLASQPGSIVLQDVRNINLRDAQGNYISPDQLGYNVTTRDYLRKELENAYGNLAKKVREGDYQTLRSTPWLMQKAVTQGITEQEVPAVAEDMMGTLKQMYPTLPEDVVQSIATEQASQLVLGTQNKEQTNWKYQQDYNFGQQKDMYKWQLDEKARREQPAPPNNPFSTSYGEGESAGSNLIQKKKDSLDRFKKVHALHKNLSEISSNQDLSITQLKNDYIKTSYKAPSDGASLGVFLQTNKSGEGGRVSQNILKLYSDIYGTDDLVVDRSGNITGIKSSAVTKVGNRASEILMSSDKEFIQKLYDNVLKPYKNNPTFVELTQKHGLSDIEAAEYVTNEDITRSMRHDRLDRATSDKVVAGIITDLRTNIGDVGNVIDVRTGKKDKDGFNKAINKGTEPIIQFNLNDRTVRLTTRVDGEDKTYDIPINSIQNSALKNFTDSYGKFVDRVYSPSTSTEKPVEFNSGDSRMQFYSKYDPTTKQYYKYLGIKVGNNIYKYSSNPEDVMSGAALPIEYGLDALADLGASRVNDLYGTEPEYKTRQR